MASLDDLALVDIDPEVLPEGECPWERYARAPRESWAARWGNTLVVLDPAVARNVLADARFHQGVGRRMEENLDLDPRFVERRRLSLLMREGPDHARLRRLATWAFTPRAAARHRPFMRAVMRDLADRVPADGRCDAVETITSEYPIIVVCRVFGAPAEDVPVFSRLAQVLLDAQSGAPQAVGRALAGHEELDQYVEALIERRRSHPGDDLLSDLIQAEEHDGRLTTKEIVHIAGSVLLAGTDTTRNQLAIGLHLFADHPDQWALLGKEPERLEAAVEEMVRFSPVGPLLYRYSDEDVELSGQTVPAGTMVAIHVACADRHESHGAGLDVFDIRRDPIPSLAFGHGPKYCIGAPLARAELAEGISVLRERFSTIEHDGDATWRSVGFVQGPIELPLRFGR